MGECNEVRVIGSMTNEEDGVNEREYECLYDLIGGEVWL